MFYHDQLVSARITGSTHPNIVSLLNTNHMYLLAGHHDRYLPVMHFQVGLRFLFTHLRDQYGGLDINHAPQIVWKGNMIDCDFEFLSALREVDGAAQDIAGDVACTHNSIRW